MHRASFWLLIAATCVATADEAARPTLRLRNGDYVAGKLLDSADAALIDWQADGFARSLRFPIDSVRSLQYPLPGARPELAGPYCFELAGGDLLAGDLVSLDSREVVLDLPVLGKVSVERSALQRFYRTGAADLVYSGPSGLDGWKTVGPEKAWRDEGGQLRTDQPGAAIGREDRPPTLVRYEIELAWNNAPDFEFSAGLSQHVAGKTAFRLETWGDELVVTRESDQQGDVAVLQKIAPSAGAVALSVLFDESQGRLLVYSSAGEQVADFTVPVDKPRAKPAPKPQNLAVAPIDGITPRPEPPSGLLLTNRRGTLTLQHLAIRRWSGIAPHPAAAGHATIHLTDGVSQSAEVRSFDAKVRQLVVVKDGKEQRIEERQLQDVVLARGEEPRPRTVRVLLANGARLSGELTKVEQDAVLLTSPVVKEPFTVPVKELQAVVMLGSSPPGDADNAAFPRLELPGASLRGSLTEARQGEDSCLVFQPRNGSVASPLAADVSGKLIFREAPPPPQAKPQAVAEESAVGQVVSGLKSLLGNTKPATLRPKAPGDCLLHLRSGDTIPCRVEFIDERGITFKSALTEAGFVPHERVKALELRLDARPVKIEKTRFDRLLTLPRMQRDNPPEQLIRSLEGDYLRGRLISMNDKELEIEMRLDVRKVARDQVTRILWLHPDAEAKATVAKADEPADRQLPKGIRVQAVPRGGNRITFFAQEYTGKTLSGQSELLGACHVELDQVDQLLIGATIEEAAATLAFHQWKLRSAAEPLPDPEPGADPGSGDGMESVLVGKPAPAIELDLLAGGKFKLADCKDKIVVLDFWASWCGPCLQAMPQVDKVAAEFAEQGVQLVAINLEETPDQVETALSRLKLETAVALDKDGRIAERYGATDIPQTVIIGRDGKVARLFVGGGSRFDERLRQALKAVLAE
jgi:thiol-disulfide isomerase/thioredoxin/sRNA-binding regulator protein Hfq